jgi:hypothetical protein
MILTHFSERIQLKNPKGIERMREGLFSNILKMIF